MKIHCPVLAVAVIVTILPLNSGTDISSVQKVASCDKSSLRRSLVDFRTSDVNENELSSLDVALDEEIKDELNDLFNPSSVNVANTQDTFSDVVKEDKLNPQRDSSISAVEKLDKETWNGHDNSQSNEEEELDEAAKDEMTEKRTTEKETAETETAPSKIAVFNSSSIVVANTQKALRAVTKEEDFEAQKDGSSSVPENLDEETWGEHDNSHSDEAEEPDEVAGDEMAEEETGNDNLLTAIAKIAAFNSSSVNVADTQKALRGVTRKEDLNAQEDGSNSAAGIVDEKTWGESSRTRSNEIEELDDAAKDEKAQEEMAEKQTKKDDLLTTIAPPKFTVLNPSSINVADTLDNLKDAIKEEELNAPNDGLNSAAEDFDEEARDEINNFQFNEVKEFDEAAEEKRVEKETIEKKAAEDELLTTNVPSEVAIFDSPPVDVADTQNTLRSETKDGEVSAQNFTGGLMIMPPATPSPAGSTNGKVAEEEIEEEYRDEEAKSSAAQSGNEEESEPEIEEESTDEEAQHDEEDDSEDDSSDD